MCVRAGRAGDSDNSRLNWRSHKNLLMLQAGRVLMHQVKLSPPLGWAVGVSILCAPGGAL
jgi:hypothetical protein